MALKSYEEAQAEKTPEPDTPVPTGVACIDVFDGEPCPGEMMWSMPLERHPEIPTLSRAKCAECGWLGWV